MKTNVLKLLFCIFLGIAKLHASHIVGGKIDYQSLGGGNYEITYTEYIDCSGISSGSNVTLNMEPLGTCGAGTSQITLTQLGIPYDVTPLCPGTNSQCSGGGTAYGVNRIMYHTTINAANFPCSKYRIYYTNCCRNSSIVNLANGGAGLDFYIAVDTLNFAINNSSPFFINNPIIALCSGQSIDFSQAATDADGDSIVYALVPNLGLNGTPISYNIGYSLGNLLGTGWNVSINANTGKLSFTATGAGAIGI